VLNLARKSVPRLSTVTGRVNTGSDVNSIITVMGNTIEENRIALVKESPAWSLLIDESADWAKQEQLTVNVIIVSGGEKVSLFLTLIAIKHQDSKTIFEALVQYFESHGVSFDNLYGFGSDGAANMMGKNSGVAARFKGHVAHHIVSIHCIAHICALSAKQGVESSLIARNVDRVIKGVAATFSRSSTATSDFTDLQLLFSEFNTNLHAPTSVLRIVPYHEIRWLSRFESVSRLLKVMPPLLTFFSIKFEKDGEGIYPDLLNYENLKFLYVVHDILEPLRAITLVAQSQSVTIPTMFAVLAEQIGILNSLKTNVGAKENEFMELLEYDENGFVSSFYGHKLTFKDNSDDRVNRAKRKYIKTVVEDLNERFAALDENLLSFRCIYSCLVPYENFENDVQILANLYDMNSIDLERELTTFRLLVNGAGKKFSNFNSMAKYILTSFGSNEFTLLTKLVAILVVMPFATADCERSFSAMNRIKNPERSRLLDVLKPLMSCYTATEKEKDDLDFSALAKYVRNHIWKYQKDDYFNNDFIV